MTAYRTTIRFASPGYIAQPYWPEMAHLIDVQKQSGINRAKTEANRRKALEEHLRGIGKTLDWYQELEVLARRPFHTDSDGHIIIPSASFIAFVVNATDVVRSASKPCPKNQVRALIASTDFVTDRKEKDGTWERFAVVSAGTGQKLSNQRGFRTSDYIENCDAIGTIAVDPEFVKPDVLKALIGWGGKNIGIGASRTMGWGRFTLTEFEKVDA